MTTDEDKSKSSMESAFTVGQSQSLQLLTQLKNKMNAASAAPVAAQPKPAAAIFQMVSPDEPLPTASQPQQQLPRPLEQVEPLQQIQPRPVQPKPAQSLMSSQQLSQSKPSRSLSDFLNSTPGFDPLKAAVPVKTIQSEKIVRKVSVDSKRSDDDPLAHVKLSVLRDVQEQPQASGTKSNPIVIDSSVDKSDESILTSMDLKPSGQQFVKAAPQPQVASLVKLASAPQTHESKPSSQVKRPLNVQNSAVPQKKQHLPVQDTPKVQEPSKRSAEKVNLSRVNYRDKQAGRTKVHKCVNWSRVQDLQEYIEGCEDNVNEEGEGLLDVTIADTANVTPFHFACFRGCSSTLKIMLEHHSQMFHKFYDEVDFDSNENIVKLYKQGLAVTDYTSMIALTSRDTENAVTPLFDIVVGLFECIEKLRSMPVGTQVIPSYKDDVDMKFLECFNELCLYGTCVNIWDSNRSSALEYMDAQLEILQQQDPLLLSDDSPHKPYLMGRLISEMFQIKFLMSRYTTLLHEADIITQLDGDLRSVLHFAPFLDSSTEAMDAISFFVRCGVDIGQQDRNGYSILHYAVLTLNIDLVYYLCALSNTTHQEVPDGTLLFSRRKQLELLSHRKLKSSKQPQLDQVKELVELVNKYDETPLHLCIKAIKAMRLDFKDYSKDEVEYLTQCCVKIARILIVSGVDVTFIDRVDKKSALQYLPEDDPIADDLEDLYAIVASFKTDVADKNPVVATPKPLSREERQVQQAAAFLEREEAKKSRRQSKRQSTEPERKSRKSTVKKERSKDRAVSEDTQSMVEDAQSSVSAMTNKTKYPDGLNPHFVDKKYHETHLIRCARDGKLDQCQLLLDRGADVNHQDFSGYTALSEAANNAHQHVVKLLLEHGANPNTHGRYGETPLHESVKVCDLQSVKLLLQYGGDPYATDRQNHTAYDYLQDDMSSPMKALGNDSNRIRQVRDQIKDFMNSFQPEDAIHSGKHRTQQKRKALEKVKQESSPAASKPKGGKRKKDDASSVSANIVKKPRKQSQKNIEESATVVSESVAEESQQTFAPVKPSIAPVVGGQKYDYKFDESKLPLLAFKVSENGNQICVLDFYLAQLFGIDKTSTFYMTLCNKGDLRENMKRSRKPVSKEQLQKILKLSQLPSDHQMFIDQLNMDSKLSWIPYELLLPLNEKYLEVTDNDEFECAEVMNPDFTAISL